MDELMSFVVMLVLQSIAAGCAVLDLSWIVRVSKQSVDNSQEDKNSDLFSTKVRIKRSAQLIIPILFVAVLNTASIIVGLGAETGPLYSVPVLSVAFVLLGNVVLLRTGYISKM